MRLLIGLCLVLGMGSAGIAEDQPAGKRPELGRQWKVHQWIQPMVDLSGRWTRLGQSDRFDVDYTNKANGEHVYSKVTVEKLTAREIVVSIEGSKARLIGTIGMDGRTIRGRMEPCPAGNTCGWTAVTDWQPPAAQVTRKKEEARSLSFDDVGTVWNVHDYTNEGFDYSGTWTLRKENKTIEFAYVDRRDGTEAKGSFQMSGSSGRTLVIYNQGRRKYMKGTVQADGKTIKGTADWCRNQDRCGWEATVVR